MQFNKRVHFNPNGKPVTTSLRTPIIRIENHNSPVLSCEFHPSGKYILSSNVQGEIHVSDLCASFKKMRVLTGHTGAVTQTQFSRDGLIVYSCSTDGTLGIWDYFLGSRIGKLEGHTGDVNCMQRSNIGYPVICSGSNDGTVRIWDSRQRECVLTLFTEDSTTALCFSQFGDYVFSGGFDSNIKIWDLRRKDILCHLQGHINKITGISLSPGGGYLLTNSADNTIRVWDVRQYISLEREVRCYQANQHGVGNLLRCVWSNDGSMISAGTADRDVFILDVNTGAVLHRLPGHQNSITDVAFHPNESIVLSASDDTYLFLHEI